MRRKHYGSLCCTFFFGPATESCDIDVSSNLKQRRFAVRLIRIRYGINIQWFFSNTIAIKRELMKVSARSSYCPLIAISNQMRETDPWYGNCSEVSDAFCTLVAAGPSSTDALLKIRPEELEMVSIPSMSSLLQICSMGCIQDRRPIDAFIPQ